MIPAEWDRLILEKFQGKYVAYAIVGQRSYRSEAADASTAFTLLLGKWCFDDYQGLGAERWEQGKAEPQPPKGLEGLAGKITLGI